MTKTVTPRIVTRLAKRRLYVGLGDLYGPSGNAFAILGAVKARMVADKRPPDEIEAWKKVATSGNYATLLTAVLDCFAVPEKAERQMRRLIKEQGPAR